MIKKIISFIVIMAFLFSNSGLVLGEEKDAYDILKEKGIIIETNKKGYMTRGEVAVIVGKILGLDEATASENTQSQYTDVKEDEIKGYIYAVSGQGMMKGYPDHTFKPDKEVTYGEAITIMVRLIDQEEAEGKWPYNYIKKAFNIGIIQELNEKDAMNPIKREDFYKMAISTINVIEKNRKSVQIGEGEFPKIAMASDVGGIEDRSFNEMAWKGLKRAQKELGGKVSYIEAEQEKDYIPNMEALRKEKNQLIVGIGFTMREAVLEVANKNKEQKYAIVDNRYEEIPENVTCILFKREEASFLAGYIAGKMSASNKIGIVGGMKVRVVDEFIYGFEGGAKYANPDIKVIKEYANTFCDVAKGKEIAEKMYEEGVDIIFHVAGDTGRGVFEAAKEKNKYAVGVDTDQSNFAPDHVLTSVVVRIDNAVFNVAEDIKNGKLQGGTEVKYGLKEGGVDLASTTNKLVPKNILEEVEKVKKDIIEGKINVPKTEEELSRIGK